MAPAAEPHRRDGPRQDPATEVAEYQLAPCAVLLTPPAKVRKLRDALHSKAKDAPGYRFYALYDKLYRDDVLRFAYDRCKANGGAPGVDGQDFADIEAPGLEAWLS